MIVAGLLVVLLGTGSLIVSVVILIGRLHDRLLLRRLRAAPRLTCQALLVAGRLPRSVVVTGETAPGPNGVLRSPAFDVPCVWFDTDVAPVEGGVGSAPVENHPVLRRSARGPIGVTDDTGTVQLDLKLLLKNRKTSPIVQNLSEDASLSHAHRAVSGSGMERLERVGLLPGSAYGLVMRRHLTLREQLVEAGRPLTVLARPRRAPAVLHLVNRGVLLRPRGAISPLGPDAWIDSLQGEISASAADLRFFFPIGVGTSVLGVVLIVISS